jgi:hypothetical protein
MTDSNAATYSFLPWVRRGLSSLIAGSATNNYASLPVSLSLNGTPVNDAPPIRLVGPADVTGLDPTAVIRTDPPNGNCTFEPNYLVSVELATPDLPWMFTPSAPASGRLQPWICLIVVEDSDGASIQSQVGGPDILQIQAPLDPKNILPDLTEIDVFTHAQVSGQNLSGAALNAALLSGSAAGISRLICPRQLQPGTFYNACIVPTFHAGVNAALGLPADDGDVAPAWDQTVAAPFSIPVYYHFRFGTGPGGDFVSLARAITPANLPATVGGRPMDASQPGFGAPAVPGATLVLEGALQVEGSQPAPWPAGTQTPYQTNLKAALVPAAAANPVVSPPVYGSTQTGAALPAPGANPVWLGDLNLDPRTRAAAAAGGLVIQNNQDALLASAWNQVGEIRKANQLLRQSQLARQVSLSFVTRHLNTISGDGQYLQVTAPVHGRVLGSTGSQPQATLKGLIEASIVPVRATSAQMRKLSRKRGPIARKFNLTGAPQLVDRLNLPASNTQSVIGAGPLKTPAGMVTLDAVSTTTTGTAPPIQLSGLAAKIEGTAGWHVTGTILAKGGNGSGGNGAKVTGTTGTTTATTLKAEVPSVTPELKSTGTVEATGSQILTSGTSGTVLSTGVGAGLRGGGVTPVPIIDWSKDPTVPAMFSTVSPSLPAPIVFPSDNAGLVQMQTSFQSVASVTNTYLTVTATSIPVPPPLGGVPSLDGTRTQLQATLNPEVTIAARMKVLVPLGTGPDPLQPLTSSPQFPQPMYASLAALSPEWMLPGISDAPANSAALLQTNSRFVEAFMVGLNEEMAREFVWREFPTNFSATFFQNFWSSAPDIPPIASFDGTKSLGSNTTGSAAGSTIVLLLRADLLTRYPNTIVSAAPAAWSGTVRTLGSPRQFPIFRGSIDPNFTFFGFNISDPVGTNNPTDNRPGWYFLLEEHSTEPRFGLEAGTAAGTDWNDLRWEDFTPPISFLDPSTAPQTPTRDGVTWAADGGVMAYILLRTPVRVALHGQALIPQGGTSA